MKEFVLASLFACTLLCGLSMLQVDASRTCRLLISIVSTPKESYAVGDQALFRCPGGSKRETRTCQKHGHWSGGSKPCLACPHLHHVFGALPIRHTTAFTCMANFRKVPGYPGPSVCNQDFGLYKQFCSQPVVSRTVGVPTYVAIGDGHHKLTYSLVKEACAQHSMTAPTAACNGCEDVCQQYKEHFERFYLGAFKFFVAEDNFKICKVGHFVTPILTVCTVFECFPNSTLAFSPPRPRYAIGEEVESSCHDGTLKEVLTCRSTGYWTERRKRCPATKSAHPAALPTTRNQPATTQAPAAMTTTQNQPRTTHRPLTCTAMIFGGSITNGHIRCMKDFTKVPANGVAECNQDVGLYNQICRQTAVSETPGVPSYVAVAFGPTLTNVPFTSSGVKKVCASYGMTAPTAACSGCDNACVHYSKTLFRGGFHFPIADNLTKVCKNGGAPLILCQTKAQCLPTENLNFSPLQTGYAVNSKVNSTCPGGSITETLTCLSTGEWTKRSNPCIACTPNIFGGSLIRGYIRCLKSKQFTKVPATGRAVCNQDVGLYKQYCALHEASGTPGVVVAYPESWTRVPFTYSGVKKVCASYGMTAPTAACTSSKGCNDTCSQYRGIFPHGLTFPIDHNLVRKCLPAAPLEYDPTQLIVCEVDETDSSG